MSQVTIHHIYISAGHDFKGRHGLEREHYSTEDVAKIECVAGKGIQGDRFFAFKEDFKGQITFFDWALFQAIKREFNLPDLAPHVTRRNVLIEGVDLNSLIGKTFEINGVRFEGSEECAPCYWMNTAISPGAEALMKGRGGLRARILNDGILHSKSNLELTIL